MAKPIKPKGKTKTAAKLEAELHELREKLKALEEEKSILGVEIARLRLSADMLRQIFQKCKSCGHQLRLIEWNRQGYILACDNRTCDSDRNPIARISRKELPPLLGEAVETPKIKGRERVKK